MAQMLLSYQIRDVRNDIVFDPFFCFSDGEAQRRIRTLLACPQGSNSFCSHPQEFELYRVGSYDRCKVGFDSCVPVSLGLLSDM
ncbi:nonstructural protein [Capybara microvirus Cap1_SP_167]|nr:nonstructural protein [Capybara microvirus Cap1_SP_167]